MPSSMKIGQTEIIKYRTSKCWYL